MNPDAYFEMNESEEKHWWFYGRRTISRSIIKTMFLPSDAKILEAGCGTGGNLEMLAEFGQVSAFEMNSTAYSIAKRKVSRSIDIRLGSFPSDIPFTDERFDMVCLFDVLEHIEEDIATLFALKNMLLDSGKILITVPAYQWLYGAHDEFLHHKRRYSAAKLAEIAALAGLRVKRISYFNTLLFPIIAIVRLKEKLFGEVKPYGTSIPKPYLNSLLKTFFSMERYWLKSHNALYGSSLICVLESYC